MSDEIMKYEYEKEKEYDLSERIIHKAIYKKAICEIDRNNPLIEALPPLMSMKELALKSYRGLRNFNHDEIIKSSKEIQFARLSELKLFRYPLPYQYSLSLEIYDILLNSYRQRELYVDLDNLGNLKETIEDCDRDSYVSIFSDAEEGTAGSIALLGPSGAGKSSSIKSVLKQIPQVIRHNLGQGKSFTQITYVHASCNTSTTEDFSSLLIDIGRSIDKALFNRHSVYEKFIKKQRKLGEKIDAIIKLITNFGIGLIEIDEVENLNFGKNKKASYSKLLSLMNITKVGLIFVGTNEVFEAMFTDEKMRRRFQPFNVNEYQKDENYIRLFLSSLFKYQWFDSLVYVKDKNGYTKNFLEICDVFMEWTKGIVALMVKLYHCMNAEYIIKPCKINASFTRMVASKYLYNLKSFLDNTVDPFSYKNIKEVIKNADEQIEISGKLTKYKEENDKLIALTSNDDFKKELYEKEKICKNVKELTGNAYKYSVIEKEVDKVFKLKNINDLSDMLRIKKALEYLGAFGKEKSQKPKQNKVKNTNKSKKESPEELMKELME